MTRAWDLPGTPRTRSRTENLRFLSARTFPNHPRSNLVFEALASSERAPRSGNRLETPSPGPNSPRSRARSGSREPPTAGASRTGSRDDQPRPRRCTKDSARGTSRNTPSPPASSSPSPRDEPTPPIQETDAWEPLSASVSVSDSVKSALAPSSSPNTRRRRPRGQSALEPLSSLFSPNADSSTSSSSPPSRIPHRRRDHHHYHSLHLPSPSSSPSHPSSSASPVVRVVLYTS